MDNATRLPRPHGALVASIMLALILGSFLVGCSTGADSAPSTKPASTMQTRDVPVYYEADAEPQRVTLAFFDNLPSVPYMAIDDFYSMFLHGEMNVAPSDNGTFTLTVEDGTTATVDANADTFAADDFTAFVSQPLLKGDGASTLATDLAPFLMLESETVERAASPVSIDFSRYGIDLRAEGDKLYLPLATVNDLFETSKSFRVMWDGSTVYAHVLDPNDTTRRTEPLADEAAYLEGLTEDAERAPDMAEFAYAEMCFKLDSFYGLPGSAPLNDSLAADGLDKALRDNDPQTRELLRSTDKLEYVWGLNRLLEHDLDDKNHTGFTDYESFAIDPGQPFAAKVMELESTYGMETNPTSSAFREASRKARAAKAKTFGNDAQFGTYYTEKGDTALFSFQSFKTDAQGWKGYYAGKAKLPVETDSYAALLDAISRAKKNHDIKNFVIDVSTNSGGEADAVAGICALVCGQSAFHTEDTFTGQRTTVSFKADRNADGKVDDADDKVNFGLDFAVLTSGMSYSSANLLPQLLHERGVTVIGERSGGGPCAAEECTTADGWRFTISSNTRVTSDTWENIDGGVPVDVELVKVGADGARDYSGLYDLDAMSAAL